jgi:outer membrane protein TolC
MDCSRFPPHRPPWPKSLALAGLCALSLPEAATLPELIRAGLEKNAGLLAEREEAAGASHDTLASAAAVNPELEIEALHNLTHPGSPTAGIRVSREFQVGLRRKARDAAKADWSSRRAWLRAGELDLAASIRSAYVEVLLLERKAALQGEVIARWEALARISAGQVAQGRLSEVDQSQARLNVLKARQAEMDIRSGREAALARLQVLAALPSPPGRLEAMPLDSLPVLPDPDSLKAWARAANPDLAAYAAVIAAEERRVVLEEGKAATAFHVSVGYERSEEGAHLVGGGIGMPLPFGNPNRAGILKARTAARSAELRRRAAAANLEADIAASHARLRSLAGRLGHYRGQVKDLVRRQLELSEKGFRQGLLGVFDLSRVQEEYLAQEGDALALLEEYHREWNRLGRAVGGRTW